MLYVSSPRRRHESSHGRLVLRLSEKKVRLSEGTPRRGHVCLGKLEDRKMGHSGPPRRGCCSPRRTTSPRRRRATPRQAQDLKQWYVMSCLGPVSWLGL